MGAKRITPEEIIEIQRLCRKLGTYAAVAAEIGRSASSVSKYVQMKGVPTNIRIAVENLTQKLQNTINEVELNTDNIFDYLHIEITSKETGKRDILNRPEIERTLTIYPIQNGHFNNVRLNIFDSDFKECKADPSELDEQFVEYVYSSGRHSYLMKIVLPTDGNYTCTHMFYGNLPFIQKLPRNKNSANDGWGYFGFESIDETVEEHFGSDNIKAGDPVITGTFIAD